ncbi:MAG: hypothetical protein ACPG49_07120 [Chitinophagales bacterium]
MEKELTIPPEFKKEMSKIYRKIDLEIGMKPLIFKFLLKNEKLCLEEGIPVRIYSKIRYKTITKAYLIDLCCIPFLSKKLLAAFMKSLPVGVRKILKGLMWNESITEDKIKSDFGFDIINPIKNKRIHYSKDELKEVYCFFRVNTYLSREHNRWWKYSLSIIPELRKLLIEHSPKPKNYYLNSSPKPNTDFTYNGEKDIFLELPRLIVYYEQGNIKVTAKDRLAKGTQNKMQRMLKLEEFFENTKDNVLQNLRSNAIASLFVFSGNIEYQGNQADLLKKLFLLYKKKNFFASCPRLLIGIKGINYFENSNFESVESAFFEILKEMPLEKWVTYENITDFISYRNLKLEPLKEDRTYSRLYFEIEKGNKKGHYRNRTYLRESSFELGVLKPFLKANFFLFAAFGLVEIAYNQPDTSQIIETYYSPYDGLQSVRLTKLGAYIVGKKRKYVQAEDTKPIPLVLSPDSLMILSDEKDLTADILLQTYTQKVGANRYQTDASIFLSGCTSKKQLESKITLFSKTVSNKPPANWTAFFNELKSKINPFEEVGDKYTLLKIPPTNRELIQLIAQDSVLKKLVLKGEGFHIFVKKKDLRLFKSRLKEFGFLWT